MSSGGQGKYIKYICFCWSALEGSTFLFLGFLLKNKFLKQLIKARQITLNAESFSF